MRWRTYVVGSFPIALGAFIAGYVLGGWDESAFIGGIALAGLGAAAYVISKSYP